MNESPHVDTDQMVKKIIDSEKSAVSRPVKRDPFSRLNIGYRPVIGRMMRPARKSRGIPVIYRESIHNNAPDGQITMDRILLVPRTHRAEPKNDPVAQEKAIAKRNRKARKLEDDVAAGGWGAK